MLKKVCAMAVVALAVVGCQPMNSQAQQVRLSPNSPPTGCTYVGEVSGSRDASAQEGMDKLRNQAASLGANYVQMRGNPDGTVEAANGAQVPNIVYVGKAYKCPNLDK